MAATAAAPARRIVSLAHVKEDSPVPPRAVPKIAWYGGVVTTNRTDATAKFATRLLRKQARGGTLTAAQQKVVETYKLSPAYQAQLEREAAAAAASGGAGAGGANNGNLRSLIGKGGKKGGKGNGRRGRRRKQQQQEEAAQRRKKQRQQQQKHKRKQQRQQQVKRKRGKSGGGGGGGGGGGLDARLGSALSSGR